MVSSFYAGRRVEEMDLAVPEVHAGEEEVPRGPLEVEARWKRTQRRSCASISAKGRRRHLRSSSVSAARATNLFSLFASSPTRKKPCKRPSFLSARSRRVKASIPPQASLMALTPRPSWGIAEAASRTPSSARSAARRPPSSRQSSFRRTRSRASLPSSVKSPFMSWSCVFPAARSRSSHTRALVPSGTSWSTRSYRSR